MSLKWSRAARAVLRRGAQPFDDADAACGRMLGVLESKVQLEERVRRGPLPGALHGVSGLAGTLSFALRLEAQRVLVRVGEVVNEDMYVCWKAMEDVLEQARTDADSPGFVDHGREVVEEVVRMYGQQYWTRRQLVEGVDLTREDAGENVREVVQRWEEMSLYDADLLKACRSVARGKKAK